MNNVRIRKWFVMVLLVIFIALAWIPSASAQGDEPVTLIDSGPCGDNLYWELYSNGALYVDGTGEMTSSPGYEHGPPWLDYADQIITAEIGEGITTLIRNAFADCKNLVSVRLPASLKTIGNSAFSGCSQLQEVILQEGLEYIGTSAFSDCTSLTQIHIPSTVRTIEAATFMDCSSLKTLTLPDTMDTLGPYAFMDCSSLEAVTMPKSLSNLSMNLFSFCTSLKYVVIPEGVQTVGFQAFIGCTGLTWVYFPESLTGIYADAFRECTGLEFVRIPSKVSQISWNAFLNCTSLETIYFAGSAPQIIVPDGVNISRGYLNGVTATAYYPAGNNTWTDIYRKNCAGKITWEAHNHTSHTRVKYNRQDATCTSTGYTGETFCEFCGFWIAKGKVIPMLDHTYEKGICLTCGGEDPDYVLLGDLDGDGDVTDWDAILLSRYLAGWQVEILLDAADMDQDGEVSDWDAITLDRQLAGWKSN